MNLVGEALALAADVHRAQTDKAGAPYALHPIAVMERATKFYLANHDGWALDKVQAAALLHDVFEDAEEIHGWDIRRLRDRVWKLDERVYQAVDCLTKYKDPPESYERYLDRVASDWISTIVKIADFSHNLDVFRIPAGEITERDFERWDKYHRGLVRLKRVGNE